MDEVENDDDDVCVLVRGKIYIIFNLKIAGSTSIGFISSEKVNIIFFSMHLQYGLV